MNAVHQMHKGARRPEPEQQCCEVTVSLIYRMTLSDVVGAICAIVHLQLTRTFDSVRVIS